VPQIERNFERVVCPVDHEASRLISLAATSPSKPWRGTHEQHGHAVQPLAVHQIKRDNPPDASAKAGLPQFNRDRTARHLLPGAAAGAAYPERVLERRRVEHDTRCQHGGSQTVMIWFIRMPSSLEANAIACQLRVADVVRWCSVPRSSGSQTIIAVITITTNYGSDLQVLGQVFTFGPELREEALIAVPPTG
jgi:hypothetical protein